MIAAMPRPRDPHLHRQISRHGKTVWYVRRGKGRRIRLRAEFGTDAFKAEYHAAFNGEQPKRNTKAKPGSLQWLWDEYRHTGAWSSLSLATRRQRENIMLGVLKVSGHEQADAIRSRHIEAGKEKRHETPAQARNFLDAMRGLFRWAKRNGKVKIDPTMGVENPRRQKGDGFKPWTEADLVRFEARYPKGSRERVWLHVLLYTGLRRGDAVRCGTDCVSDGVISMLTEKSGFTVPVNLRILPPLAETLAAGPVGKVKFICGERGNPLTKETFGNMFSAAAKAAGIDKSAHGVRKLAATLMAENGATVAELESVFGWSGGAMAALYTRAANRKRLSLGAMDKLARVSIPSPSSEVGE